MKKIKKVFGIGALVLISGVAGFYIRDRLDKKIVFVGYKPQKDKVMITEKASGILGMGNKREYNTYSNCDSTLDMMIYRIRKEEGINSYDLIEEEK